MRSTRSWAVGALALALLTGCSGESEADQAPSETPSASPTPTAAEYDEAHAMYHDLATVLDEAAQSAADFQTAVKRARERDPEGFSDAPDAETHLEVERQEAAVAVRERAVSELAEHPAMADEELAAAYQTFVDAYAVAMAYQDGFNDSFPMLLATDDACLTAVEVGQVEAVDTTSFAKSWLTRYEELAAPCLRWAKELSTSTNDDVAKVGDLYQAWVADRTATATRLRDGRSDQGRFIAQLRKADRTLTRSYEQIANFSETLGELMPTEEFDAVDAVFEDRVGESASPSPME